ncbi:MAG: hypothetical protein JKY31_10525 [Rhodobacteraceae bacterium]|nr:hypothetical protein [Paracoccaceae bacterium]
MSENLQALMREILDDNCKEALKTMAPSKKKLIELAGNRSHIIDLQKQIEIERTKTMEAAFYHATIGLGIPLVIWAALFISQFILHFEVPNLLRHLFAFALFISIANAAWNARIMSQHSKPNYPDGYTPIEPI